MSTSEKQTPEYHTVSRRNTLKGLLGVGALVGLDACGLPDWSKRRGSGKQHELSPEDLIRRDFETRIRQLGNGIIEQLALMPGARYEDPYVHSGVNQHNPDDYYWSQTVDNDPTSTPGRWKDPELSVRLENTRNVSYLLDGYHVEMTISSPTSNGEDGYFVMVDARPAPDSAESIESMLTEGSSVLEIATAIMAVREGVKVTTTVMYCKDDHTPGYGPYVGGKNLPLMDSSDFEQATLEDKRQTYKNYLEAVKPLERLAGIV